jgi:hypothetical protein
MRKSTISTREAALLELVGGLVRDAVEELSSGSPDGEMYDLLGLVCNYAGEILRGRMDSRCECGTRVDDVFADLQRQARGFTSDPAELRRIMDELIFRLFPIAAANSVAIMRRRGGEVVVVTG